MAELDSVYQELAQRAVIRDVAATGTIMVKVDSAGRLYEAQELSDASGASGVTVTITAGETLSGHRMVIQNFTDGKLYYADNTNLDHMHSVLGLTTQAADLDASCKVKTYGSITEPTWSWTDNKPIFLSTNGQLTQTKPTTGFLLRIGIPRSATTLLIDIEEPIKLV